MKRLFLITFIFLGFGLSTHAVLASSLTTTQTEVGTIVTTNPDGTTYLTTRISDVAATQSSTPSHTFISTPLNETQVVLSEGFATTFSGLLNGVLSFVLVISALLVFAFLIWGGFDWIVSGGDKGKTDAARQKIVSAIVGLIIVAASFAVLNLVIRFLGFTSLNDVFQSTGTIEGGAANVSSGLGALNQEASASATPH